MAKTEHQKYMKSWIRPDGIDYGDMLSWSEKEKLPYGMSIWKKWLIGHGSFLIFPFASAKNGRFFDFVELSLKYGFLDGSETLIFLKYIQFAIEWYIVCLCYEKIKALRFFSHKSINCPMGG